jgi:predicted dehydrogenase
LKKDIKVGVIGAGFIGPAHIEALRRLGIEVVAIAASTQESAERSAQNFLVPKAYGHWEDLLNDPEIDVVHITSPNYLHFPQAKRALERGKHVLCEKPLAVSAIESAELVSLASEKKLANAVCYNLRFYPLVQESKARIADDELGEKIHIIHGCYLQDWLLLESDWNWRLDPELGGKLRAIADIGSHWMDLVTFVTGTRITSVFADLATFIPFRRKPITDTPTFKGKKGESTDYKSVNVKTEDYATLLFAFENGARGVVTVSQISSGRKNRLFFEIDGSKSSLVWNSEIPNQLLIGHRNKPNQSLIKDPSLMKKSASWSASFPGGHAEGYPDTFKQFFKAFYGYIHEGKMDIEPHFPTFKDGHNMLLVEEAILKSAKEKQWMDVAYS